MQIIIAQLQCAVKKLLVAIWDRYLSQADKREKGASEDFGVPFVFMHFRVGLCLTQHRLSHPLFDGQAH